jgi:lipase chaperone LimK
MRQSHLGKKQSPDLIEKRVAPLRGRKRPPEVVARMAASQRGRRLSPEQREIQIERLRQAHLGKNLSPEHIAKLKRHKHTPESIEKMRQAKLGHEVSPETREKLRQATLAQKRMNGKFIKEASNDNG